MGCCPGRAVVAEAGVARAPVMRAGVQGLQVVYYSGTYGETTIKGPVTNVTYTFGTERVKGYVDSRDLPYFLAFEEAGKLVFRTDGYTGDPVSVQNNQVIRLG